MKTMTTTKMVCVRCYRPQEDWNIVDPHREDRIYCCVGCVKNSGCTCENDSEEYLMLHSFA